MIKKKKRNDHVSGYYEPLLQTIKRRKLILFDIDDIKEWMKIDINVILYKVQQREDWHTTCFDDSTLISANIYELRD